MLKDKNNNVFGSVDEAADYYCAHNDNCHDCPLYSKGKKHFCDNTHDEVTAKLGLEDVPDTIVGKIAMFYGAGNDAAEAMADAKKEVEKFEKDHTITSTEYIYICGWPHICCAKVVYQ